MDLVAVSPILSFFEFLEKRSISTIEWKPLYLKLCFRCYYLRFESGMKNEIRLKIGIMVGSLSRLAMKYAMSKTLTAKTKLSFSVFSKKKICSLIWTVACPHLLTSFDLIFNVLRFLKVHKYWIHRTHYLLKVIWNI